MEATVRNILTKLCRALRFYNSMDWGYVQAPESINSHLGFGQTVAWLFTIYHLHGLDKQPLTLVQFSSVQFSHSVMSNCLRPHEPQHARLPCPSPTPGVHPNPCPLSRWCHPTISSSVVTFSSCPQSFPASGYFQMNQLLASGGQSIGVSASTSVLSMNTLSFRMDRLDLLAVQGTLKNLLQHHSSKTSILQHSAFFTVQLSHPYMTTGKTIALTRWTFAGKVMFLLFNMLSRLVITFLPRSKRLLISWLQSPSAVIWCPPK